MNFHTREAEQIPPGLLVNPLPVLRVLYEAEQPIVFITKTIQGQELLAYLASEEDEYEYFIVAPSTDYSIRQLLSGSVGVREALTQTWMWLVRTGRDGSISAWTTNEAQLPDLSLPRPGTPLSPEHQIAFSTRAIGNGISLGNVPCSVISFVADAARSSLKSILDFVGEGRAEGRPTDARRAMYDLPVRQLKFASFEVGLAAPQGDLFNGEHVALAVKHLERGIAWAAEGREDHELSTGDTLEVEAVLRATLALTPPTTGVITDIEVGGYWLADRRYRLTRASRTKVSKRLRSVQTRELFLMEGRIGGIDDDTLSFTLRDAPVPEDRRGTFPEELLEDMRTYYFEKRRIKISGVIRSGKLQVSEVVPLPDDFGSIEP